MEPDRSIKAINELFPTYSRLIRERLYMGAQHYGDKSFDKPNNALIEEIQQELLDVSGWAFILWTKLEKLKKRIEGDPNAE